MQRAAANSTDSPTPSKKRKLDAPSQADLQVYRKAVEQEEAIRIAALERQIKASGETRWVLATTTQKADSVDIVKTSLAEMDRGPVAANGDTEPTLKTPSSGRKSYGGYNKAPEKAEEPDKSDS